MRGGNDLLNEFEIFFDWIILDFIVLRDFVVVGYDESLFDVELVFIFFVSFWGIMLYIVVRSRGYRFLW